MGYVGNEPSVNFTSFAKQDITGDGGASYTLTYAVANANEIEVFVNNVRQEPTSAYSVSGTALTMTGNVASTDDFYVIYLGKALQTTVPPDSSVTNAKIANSTIDLTSKVTGVLPVANGGTGQSAKPMFLAYGGSSNVSLANDTWVKVSFSDEQYDIGGYYDPTTNYRYTPLVAGKYLITARVFITYGSEATENIRIAIYKNGSTHTLYNDYGGSTQSYGSVQIVSLIDMNGSSDYLEIYVRQNTSTDAVYNASKSQGGEFSGFLVE